MAIIPKGPISPKKRMKMGAMGGAGLIGPAAGAMPFKKGGKAKCMKKGGKVKHKGKK